jgi:hypothetical protein
MVAADLPHRLATIKATPGIRERRISCRRPPPSRGGPAGGRGSPQRASAQLPATCAAAEPLSSALAHERGPETARVLDRSDLGTLYREGAPEGAFGTPRWRRNSQRSVITVIGHSRRSAWPASVGAMLTALCRLAGRCRSSCCPRSRRAHLVRPWGRRISPSSRGSRPRTPAIPLR